MTAAHSDFGFLVVVCSGEYDSYSESPIGFTMDRAIADEVMKAHNAAQKRRRLCNRAYAEVYEVAILKSSKNK